VIRRAVLTSLVALAMGGFAAPALAAGFAGTSSGQGDGISALTLPPLPGFTNRDVCISGDDPSKAICVWAPLPV
jgi:hypothetical protein